MKLFLKIWQWKNHWTSPKIRKVKFYNSRKRNQVLSGNRANKYSMSNRKNKEKNKMTSTRKFVTIFWITWLMIKKENLARCSKLVPNWNLWAFPREILLEKWRNCLKLKKRWQRNVRLKLPTSILRARMTLWNTFSEKKMSQFCTRKNFREVIASTL